MVINSNWPFSEALSITEFLESKYFKEKRWVKNIHPNYAGLIRIALCIDHWVNGIPWADTGVYEFMGKNILYHGKPWDGCITRSDIIERYNKLDLIFEQVKKEGRIRLSEEIDSLYRRHRSDLGFVHIDSNCEIYWVGPGHHRFAIAYILKIPFSAQIGLVHVNAIPYLNNFRKLRLG